MKSLPPDCGFHYAVSRAVTLAASYAKNPDWDGLTSEARRLFRENPERTPTDVAYLMVRNGQQELPLQEGAR